MKHKWIFPFLLLCICIFRIEGQEIVVKLQTEADSIPIAIKPFDGEKSLYPKEYVQKLEKTFRFDFNHNGKTAPVSDPRAAPSYSISIRIIDRQLHAKLSSGSKLIQFDPLTLSGNAIEDSRKIHGLSDAIFEKITGGKGIASTRILFTKKLTANGQQVSEIWQCDYNGDHPRRVIKDAGYCVTPSYIPPKPGHSSGSIVYVSYLTGQPKIYAASLNEGQGRMLISLSGNQLMPAVSLQRDKIAFISDAAGNPDLFIQDFDPEKGATGKPRHLYTSPYSVQGSPSFSPDGSKIAFVSNKSGIARIYLLKIPPNGTPLKNINLQLLSKFTKGSTAPSWSPDGTKIAYCSLIDGVHQIVVYDLITGDERQITNGPKNKENPSWAPNSLHLIYNTTDAGACDLYVINLNQTDPVKLNTGLGQSRYPSWEPISKE